MRKLGQLLLISLIAIILAPAVITILLGNNELLAEGNPMVQIEQEEKEDASIQEQIIGVLAKEIPITYEIEAIKAQAIIARSNNQPVSYITNEELKELWGSDYNKNYSKIKKAVEETANKVITYEGETVQGVYHMQNTGYTQSSGDIWGVQTAYLESVESEWDKNGADLIKEKVYTADEVVKRLNGENNTIILQPYKLETQIQIIERTKEGYVKAVQVGNGQMTGDAFRRMLNLRSSCFAITYAEGNVIFITKGAGHGVGLSQYGANEMAREGKSCEEILKHYFPATTIQSIQAVKKNNVT